MPSALLSRSSIRHGSRRKALTRALRIESLEARQVLSTTYLVHDLVSDQPGVAPITDPNLVNAWGIALSTSSPFWVASNKPGLAEVYSGDVGNTPLTKGSLEVTITGGAPTGTVFNTTTDFKIPMGSPTLPAVFIFASESGAVTGWNPNVPAAGSKTAVLGFQAMDEAIYKGIALANDSVNGNNYLYLADFHNNKIDVLDKNFAIAHLGGSFTDPNLPAGFAPFNVAEINGQLYVSYAKQDNPADAEDDMAGPGNGVIDVYTNDGVFVKRLVSNGAGSKLNSPWGMVVAPASFGDFGGDLLVGNFGDGRIHAYDATTGAFLGTLTGFKNRPVHVDGLWGLAFGNGTNGGDANTLYFAAGPDDEAHGLFGKITANPAGTAPVTAVLNGDVLTITGGPDADNIHVRLKRPTNQIIVQDEGVVVGTFDAAAVSTIEIMGLAGKDHIVVDPKIDATVIADGGADNDKINSGKNSTSILLGGPGNDMLFAGHGRDILIGGDGKDRAHGFQGDDILIGGSTTFDTDTVALLQILDEWNSSDSFNTRVMKLSTGAGGLPKLEDGTTVLDDSVVDHLVGGPGHNWFFAGVGDKHSKH
jgi:uncharacterized protein (TIGR03118 family)